MYALQDDIGEDKRQPRARGAFRDAARLPGPAVPDGASWCERIREVDARRSSST